MKTRHLVSTIFLISFIVSATAALALNPVKAQTGTDVSQVIGSDTTWTQTNSPYNFVGNALVNNGVTLTIGEGVTVNLNNYYLRVNGTLVIQPGVTINMQLIGDAIQVNGVLSAVGTNNNPIYFNGGVYWHNFPSFASTSDISIAPDSAGWNSETNSGSIIENVVVNYTDFQVASAARISNCSFLSDSSLVLLGSSPTVTENNIACSLSLIDGINLVGGNENGGGEVPLATSPLSPTVSDNTVTGGLFVEAGSGAVTDNTVLGGLTVSDAYSCPVSTLIERNLVTNSSVGITVNFQSAGNDQSIIENNTITNNGVGVQIGGVSSPSMSNNNIYDNSLNAKLTGSTSVNLPNNWWGTTDQQVINQSIYDYKNDFNLGTLNFTPVLTAENPDALPNPDLPFQTPTATPSPTTGSSTTSPTPLTPQPTNQTTTSKQTNPTITATPAMPQNQHTTPTFNLSVMGLLSVIAALLAVIAGLIVAVVLLLQGRKAKQERSD